LGLLSRGSRRWQAEAIVTTSFVAELAVYPLASAHLTNVIRLGYDSDVRTKLRAKKLSNLSGPSRLA
jgi:hypothetical protein